MKKFIFIALFFLFSFSYCSAQIEDTVFFDENFLITKRNSGSYYRICLIDTTWGKYLGLFVDYDMDGGIVLKGNYNNSGQKDGVFTRYYSTGGVYSAGSFKNDKMDGVWKYFNEDGTPWETIQFVGDDFSVLKYFTADGDTLLIDGTGTWEKNTIGYNEKYGWLTAYFTNGEKSGKWEWVNQWNEKITLDEKYVKGKFRSGKEKTAFYEYNYEVSKFDPSMFYFPSFIHIDAYKYSPGVFRDDYPYFKNLPVRPSANDDDEEVYALLENPAVYPGGMSAFYSMISKLMQYPEAARLSNIEGKVYVQFVIDKQGQVTDVQAVKGIGSGCDEEAVRVVKEAGNWNPAQQRGRAVKQRIVIPIRFRL